MANLKVFTNIDLNTNQLLNAKLQVLASDPSSPGAGQIYYNSVSNEGRIYNGSVWKTTNVTSLPFSSITSTPTTIAGYGITDAASLPITEGDVTNLISDLALKAPLASPTFTGTVTIPTASAGDNTTKAASTAYVRGEIASLIASAPGTLDTLNELATALGDDPNFATTVTNSLALKAPLASPALTGNPTAPTQAASDNSTRVATTAYVDAAVTGITGVTHKFVVDIGDTSATAFTITHNLNSRNVDVDVSQKATPYNKIYPEIAKATLNTCTVTFVGYTPSTNEFTVTVIG